MAKIKLSIQFDDPKFKNMGIETEIEDGKAAKFLKSVLPKSKSYTVKRKKKQPQSQPTPTPPSPPEIK
ncbi:hypothetical protein LCGC14_0534960 [marine sediment metagenome]|uniref:Uncharacterized protein n=1 Tax=marine sediment metagenome TaxID=412755 RepID=A0A0F9V2K5_9ZZZZ